MKKNLIAIIIISFFCSRCKKSAPTPMLPAITQEGKNTFGCKVNGKVWVPYWPCADFVAGASELTYNIQPINLASPGHDTASLPIYFFLVAGNYTNGESFLEFTQSFSGTDHIYGTGNIFDSLLINYSVGSGPEYQNYYGLPAQPAPRYFQINKLDTVNKIVSGAFAFTLYVPVGPNGLDSIVVTEGRFDLKIGAYASCTN